VEVNNKSFYGKTRFSKTNDDVIFDMSSFEGDICFLEVDKNILFMNCIFKDTILRFNEEHVEFENCTFIGNVSIKNSLSEDDVSKTVCLKKCHTETNKIGSLSITSPLITMEDNVFSSLESIKIDATNINSYNNTIGSMEYAINSKYGIPFHLIIGINFDKKNDTVKGR